MSNGNVVNNKQNKNMKNLTNKSCNSSIHAYITVNVNVNYVTLAYIPIEEKNLLCKAFCWRYKSFAKFSIKGRHQAKGEDYSNCA